MDLGQARDRQGRLLQDSSNRFNTEYTASVEGIVNLQRKQVISRLEIDGNIRFGDSFSQGGENELGSEWTRWTLFDGRDAWTYRPFRTSGVYRYGPSRLDFERPSASDVGPIDEHWFARGFACVDCVFDPRQCFGGPELAIEYLRSTAAAVEGLIASNAFDADLFRFNQRERNGIEYQWIVTDPSWSVPAYLRRRSEWVVAERSGYHFTRCRTIRQLDEEILFECHVDFRNQEGAFLPTAFVVRTYDPENGQYRFSRSVRFVEHQLDVEIDERTFSLGNFDLPRSVETFSSVTPDSLQPPAQRRTPERIPEDASTFVEGQPYEADLSQVWRSLLIVVGSPQRLGLDIVWHDDDAIPVGNHKIARGDGDTSHFHDNIEIHDPLAVQAVVDRCSPSPNRERHCFDLPHIPDCSVDDGTGAAGVAGGCGQQLSPDPRPHRPAGGGNQHVARLAVVDRFEFQFVGTRVFVSEVSPQHRPAAHTIERIADDRGIQMLSNLFEGRVGASTEFAFREVYKPEYRNDFQRDLLVTGGAVRDAFRESHHEVGGFFHGASDEDCPDLPIEPVPIFAARTVPSGTITTKCWSDLIGMLQEALAAAGPLDGLLVAPHGATVSEAEPDADGHWLSVVREQVGADIPIIGTLDAHANLSPRMVDACNAL
ncbi:M81 family peptidase (Fragment), partial [Durusdinium trenchii]